MREQSKCVTLSSGAMFSKSEVQETNERRMVKMNLTCKDNSSGMAGNLYAGREVNDEVVVEEEAVEEAEDMQGCCEL